MGRRRSTWPRHCIRPLRWPAPRPRWRSALIRELEGIDRGRYGGPVGWVDGDGNGKWAVALRSAELSDDGTVRAYAGAGILGDSDPDRELAETKLKFRPIVEAFG